ncbi:hypothetical protein [Microcoleus sp. PH2017_05_CCC_O_A]|nr:hypothetical protein [Microcoleus sp. PH2017_05_CCC_O_A]
MLCTERRPLPVSLASTSMLTADELTGMALLSGLAVASMWL